MRKPLTVAVGERDLGLRQLPAPLPLDELVPGSGEWEVELGFGKGRYLLRRALAEPQRRFLGVEMAAEYHRLLIDRARRRGVGNLVALRGEALFCLAAVLPPGFAAAVHVYFPDPWPKERHQRRRLFDPSTVDLVLGLLRPGGELFFATDFLEYGALVEEILGAVPGLSCHRRDLPWGDGARTNYEAKYLREGRAILRLEGRLSDPGARFHPDGSRQLVAAPAATGERSEPAGERAAP